MKLFHDGRAPHMIVSGGAVGHPTPEAEIMHAVALEAGVPTERIVIELEARNTFENAVFSHCIMEQRGWARAGVVTDAYHLPRALYIFRTLGIAAEGSANRDPGTLARWKWYGAYLREAAATAKSACLFAAGRHKPAVAAARRRAGLIRGQGLIQGQ